MTDYDPFGECRATNSVTNERCTLNARHEGPHVGEQATWGGENRLPETIRAITVRCPERPCALDGGHAGDHITRDGTWPQQAVPPTQESVNDAMMVLERRVSEGMRHEGMRHVERSLASVAGVLNKSIGAVAAGEREARLRVGERVTELGDGLGEIERRMTALESRMTKLVQDLKPVTEPAPPHMEYPHQFGNVVVIGPECTTVDGSSITYKGVTYIPASFVPGAPTTAEMVSKGLERLKREISLAPPECGHTSPSGSWTCIRPKYHRGWHEDAEEGAPVRHTWPRPCGTVSPSDKICQREKGHDGHHANLGADGMDQMHWTNDGRVIHPDLCMDGSGEPWCRQEEGHVGECDPEPEMSAEEISAIEDAIREFGTGL